MEKIYVDIITNIIQVLVASGLITGLITYIVRYLKQKAKIKFQGAFVNISEVYDVLMDLKSKTNCKRISIIKANNGGGIPSIDNQVYLTILYEVFDGDEIPMKDNVQSRPADHFHCVNILSPIADPKGTHTTELHVTELDGEIERIYRAFNWVYSKAFKINNNSKRMIYIAFVFNKEKDEIKPLEYEHMLAGVNKMKEIFKK